MRGRVFFWVVLVPFGLFVLPSHLGLFAILGVFFLVFLVVAAFREPPIPTQRNPRASGACGAWTSRMRGPCRLPSGHYGSHSSR